MARVIPRNPLILVLGATGTGKSQLAVEIAKRYNGEIINGDAMQLYAGLPIITNKITREEQQDIPHHLLGCIGLREQPWVVGSFIQSALGIIEEIRSRGRLPVLVGGTHYYTQNLLFQDHLAQQEGHESKPEYIKDPAERWPVLQSPTPILLDELKKVDPVMADRWHPNDRRKIRRSLEIYLQTGRPASEIYAQQRQGRDQSNEVSDHEDTSSSAKMRFPTLLLWVHAEMDALRARLDQRVDKMLASGLLDEVETLNVLSNAQTASEESIDETKGIWVSIGYKQFKQYVDALSTLRTEDEVLEAMKKEALERTKIATRQYAKRQLTWIRIKLVNALIRVGSLDSLYLLDGTNVDSFDTEVKSPALRLTEQFLRAETMPSPSSLNSAASQMLSPKRNYDLSATPEKWSKQYCEVCEVTCITPEQWLQHTKSNTHKKRTRKAKSQNDVGASHNAG